MGRERDEKVRDRAYQIWKNEGEPSGQDQDHWYRAEQQVGQGTEANAPAAVTPAAKRGRGPRAAKAPAPPKPPAPPRKRQL